LDNSKWLFKSKDGWEDYFLNVELKYDNKSEIIREVGHSDVLEKVPIIEYKNYLPRFYKYNERTLNKINETKQSLKLTDGNYDSIFIRRGDKLVNESIYYSTKDYYDYLLSVNPNCKKIFLQTDDYNSYLDLVELTKDRNIEVLTLCDKNSFGVIVSNGYKDQLVNNKENINNDYIDKIKSRMKETKSVEDMNSVEKYDHVMKMIVGIDILANSNICILDYQSNVSRFIKLFHKDINHVYDIITKTNELDVNKVICPAYKF